MKLVLFSFGFWVVPIDHWDKIPIPSQAIIPPKIARKLIRSPIMAAIGKTNIREFLVEALATSSLAVNSSNNSINSPSAIEPLL